MQAKICLVLTENTIEKNLTLIETYRKWIDAAELRADFLLPQELLSIRRFPQLARIPVILTVRRLLDGGQFRGGEGSRITLFAHGLAFSDTNPENNFAYIDLESDMCVPSLEEAAQAYNIRIIRSLHSIKTPIADIPAAVRAIRRSDHEIVKIAYRARNLADVTELFAHQQHCPGEKILVAMGKYGIPSRILASVLGSSFVYTMPEEYIKKHNLEREYLDPVTLNTVYRFRSIDTHTKIYGVAGADVSRSLSPVIHNKGFTCKRINAVYIPISATGIEQVIDFSHKAGLSGISVTYPFKFDVIPSLDILSSEAKNCGAVNTVLYSTKRIGCNTDIDGFLRALQEFLHVKHLRFKRVAIIGTGGAAHAAAHAVHTLRANACVFGRSAEKAKNLAAMYRFRWAVLDSSSIKLLQKYSYLIIQTTPIGMTEGEDPLEFYSFSGTEHVFDVIYTPEKTALLQRAEKAGCTIENGYKMLHYQAYKQFELFTGEQYE